MPPGYDAAKSAPVVLVIHGGGGNSQAQRKLPDTADDGTTVVRETCRAGQDKSKDVVLLKIQGGVQEQGSQPC